MTKPVPEPEAHANSYVEKSIPVGPHKALRITLRFYAVNEGNNPASSNWYFSDDANVYSDPMRTDEEEWLQFNGEGYNGKGYKGKGYK